MKYFMIPVELTDAAAQMSNAEFRDAMFSLDAKLDEMAVRLGIARRLVADYRKDKKIPRSVAMATRFLLGMADRKTALQERFFPGAERSCRFCNGKCGFRRTSSE